MNKILVLFLLSLIIESSIETDNNLSNKLMPIVKCFFNSKERVEALSLIIETLFSSNNFGEWLNLMEKINPILKDCIKLDITDIIKNLIGN